MTAYGMYYHFSRILSYLLMATFGTLIFVMDGSIPKIFSTFALVLVIGYLCCVECIHNPRLTLWVNVIPFTISVYLAIIIINI